MEDDENTELGSDDAGGTDAEISAIAEAMQKDAVASGAKPKAPPAAAKAEETATEEEATTEEAPPPPDLSTPEGRAEARRQRAIAAEQQRRERRTEAQAREAEQRAQAAERAARHREQQAEQRLEAERQALARQQQEFREQVLAGGITGLQRLGISPEELARVELEQTDPRFMVASLKQQIEDMRREAAERRQQEEHRQAQAQRAEQKRQQENRLLAQQVPNAPHFTAVAERASKDPIARRILIAEADQFAQEYRETYGEMPEYREVAVELDRRLAVLQATRDAQATGGVRAPGDGVGAAQATRGANQSAQAKRPPNARALGASDVSDRVSPPRELSKEEREEEELRALAEAMRKDRES